MLVTAPTLDVVPVTPTIGAEIHGVDLAQDLTDAQRDAILDALHCHQVVFFRDQDLDAETLVAFGRRFGTLSVNKVWTTVPGHPEVVPIHADATSTNVAGEVLHSDMTFTPEPPMGSILTIKVSPATGGDTLWSNMYAAYDALSTRLQSYLDGLTAVHTAARAMAMASAAQVRDDAVSHVPTAVHPVIRTHPATGRKAIFVNPFFTSHLNDVPEAESRAVLQLLYEHCADPIFSVRFRWRESSVAFWDNRCTLHRAMKDYLPATRSGLRVQLQGDRPV